MSEKGIDHIKDAVIPLNEQGTFVIPQIFVEFYWASGILADPGETMVNNHHLWSMLTFRREKTKRNKELDEKKNIPILPVSTMLPIPPGMQAWASALLALPEASDSTNFSPVKIYT